MNAFSPLDATWTGQAHLGMDWCPDEDTRDNVVARRNVLAGLWAGSLMGLSGPELTAYVFAVHAADHQVAGDEDIVAKLTADLHRSGLPDHAAQVRPRLGAFHRDALRQTMTTD
ncbi:ATPase inhibitor subunit zeta [Microvirga guangxiensis]|uniref:DUF1476 domain-containing protein n=1 Tax=Microvirga guangxiensis TaxID=549386 RepID=A0A1G5KDW5_9HYPH|nr:ATPase inhibitor subunit zeta [Microvirga guangxiensis]SCY98268.1 hypothetical protein SAMN02927923_03212 [Microvirga guangxiensis]